jgi:ribosomal protein S12 methylthiotransferase accessory factor
MTDHFLDLGGTIRAVSPEQSLARLRPLLPMFGITRVMAQEGLADFKIPVSVSCRPNSRLISTSQGKGITRELADISAIMESIELFHAERIPPAVLVASTAELRRSGKRFLEPPSLAVIPTRLSLYSEDERLGWLELERLADGEPVLVPRFHFDLDRASLENKEDSLHAFDVSSNGLASGNTREEAIVHGLYELIERYCVCEYFKLDLEQRRARNLDMTTVDVASVQEAMKLVERTGFRLGVRAVPGPFGIPVFRARLSGVAADQAVDRSPLSDGYGAHYMPEVALLRAITEAVQVRVTYITGSRDDIFPQAYKHLDPETLKVFPPSTPVLPAPVRWSDVPRAPRFTSFTEVIRWTVDVLDRNGFSDTCYFDHQRAEYGGIPVVTVVCPKLRYDRKVFHATEQE